MGLDEFMKIQQEAYNRYQKEVKRVIFYMNSWLYEQGTS